MNYVSKYLEVWLENWGEGRRGHFKQGGGEM